MALALKTATISLAFPATREISLQRPGAPRFFTPPWSPPPHIFAQAAGPFSRRDRDSAGMAMTILCARSRLPHGHEASGIDTPSRLTYSRKKGASSCAGARGLMPLAQGRAIDDAGHVRFDTRDILMIYVGELLSAYYSSPAAYDVTASFFSATPAARLGVSKYTMGKKSRRCFRAIIYRVEPPPSFSTRRFLTLHNKVPSATFTA